MCTLQMCVCISFFFLNCETVIMSSLSFLCKTKYCLQLFFFPVLISQWLLLPAYFLFFIYIYKKWYTPFFFRLDEFPNNSTFFYILIITVTHTHTLHTHKHNFLHPLLLATGFFSFLFTHTAVCFVMCTVRVFIIIILSSRSLVNYTRVLVSYSLVSASKQIKKIQFFGQNTFVFLFILS